jgi:hypothetical protein
MSKRILLGTIILTLFGNGITLADRTLEQGEVLQIFEQLTAQPRRTWIPAGTIEATHLEYKASKITDANEINREISQAIQRYQNETNKHEPADEIQKMKLDAIPFNIRYKLTNEYTMNSREIIKFDGDRFFWEIDANSRTDSIKPGRDLADNFMTENFDLNTNARRIFVWDGEKYTKYFLSGNNTIIDTRAETLHNVNGPLTAGIVPWGVGYYRYENLVAITSSAIEKNVDNEIQIQLKLEMPNNAVTTFVLDPAKNYAVISSLTEGNGRVTVFKKYSDYQLIADKWVPMTILLEKYDSVSKRLLARDLWSISRIDLNVPGIENFKVNYELNAQVEYISPITQKPAMYCYSGTIDTDSLLAERLTYAASQDTHKQNCATAALKYALSKLGKESTQDELASLVSASTGSTSLAAMQQFVQEKGLFCKAVKTNVQTLKNLNNYQVILHIPGKGHFIVLEAIDDKYVWTIDISSDKFYYRTDKAFFGMDWTDGTALLLSNQPISQDANLIEITGDELTNITGGVGYDCTRLLQEAYTIFCDEPVQGLCGGTYEQYYTRWGCQTAPSGSCRSSILPRYDESPCINDIYYPEFCTVTGIWTTYYMRACQ